MANSWRCSKVPHLPILVGVIEVLVGVLDLAHVHHHFSISFTIENSPKFQQKPQTNEKIAIIKLQTSDFAKIGLLTFASLQ